MKQRMHLLQRFPPPFLPPVAISHRISLRGLMRRKKAHGWLSSWGRRQGWPIRAPVAPDIFCRMQRCPAAGNKLRCHCWTGGRQAPACVRSMRAPEAREQTWFRQTIAAAHKTDVLSRPPSLDRLFSLPVSTISRSLRARAQAFAGSILCRIHRHRGACA